MIWNLYGTEIRDMLSAVDKQDVAAFERFLAEDVCFVFGNGEAIHGREKIAATMKEVFQSLATIVHTVQRFWLVDSVAICEGASCTWPT